MDPARLDLKKLRAFQLAAKLGTLRRAATRLRLTIAAVSFQIRKLEEELEVPLFQRLPNRLVLTPAGERLAHETEAIFSQVERSLGMLKSVTQPSGRLSLSTSSDLAWYFAPRISRFLQRYPGIDVSLHIYKSSETLALVSGGDLDVGIGYFPRLPRSLVRDSVIGSTLSLACAPSHSFLRSQPPRLEDIARHQMISLPSQSSTRKTIDRIFAESGIATRSVIEAGNCQTAMEFAARGVGIAIVHSLCAGHFHSAPLSFVELGQKFGRIDFSVIYRRAFRQQPTLQRLIEELTAREED